MVFSGWYKWRGKEIKNKYDNMTRGVKSIKNQYQVLGAEIRKYYGNEEK